MSKVNFPETVSFRTTSELRKDLEKMAKSRNKSLSAYLNEIIKSNIVQETKEYSDLVNKLAKLRGKDSDWVKRRLILHKTLLVSDHHHYYTEESAIDDILDEIKYVNQCLQNKI
jgi:predicted DNA-binding protein